MTSGAPVRRTLHRLRNTRDLRAELLSLAGELAGSAVRGELVVVDPAVSAPTIESEWARLTPVIVRGIRERMSLRIEVEHDAAGPPDLRSDVESPIAIERPNYRYEVVRLLIGARLGDVDEAGAPLDRLTQRSLIDALGVSQTPVRAALAALLDAGMIPSLRNPVIEPGLLSMEQLGRIGAVPQTVRLRFARGARIRSPLELLERATRLLTSQEAWSRFELSGTPVALTRVPSLDLQGTPRLDLLVRVGGEERGPSLDVLQLLDDGLEVEPSALVSVPVVVTLTRAERRYDQSMSILGSQSVPCAASMDVFLSMLDIGLRSQAIEFVRGLRV